MQLFSPDKLVHLVMFGVLSWLLGKAMLLQYSQGSLRYINVVVLLVTSATGITTELLQALLPIGREASIYDAIADVAGGSIAMALFTVCIKKKTAFVQRNQKNN